MSATDQVAPLQVGGQITVVVRYFASAAAAAGRPEEPFSLPAPATVQDLTAAMLAARPELAPVLRIASLLVDGIAGTDPAGPLASGQQVDVLPPFAGG